MSFRLFFLLPEPREIFKRIFVFNVYGGAPGNIVSIDENQYLKNQI